MKVLIKNMVCNRCIHAVSSLLTELKIHYTSVQLGEINLQKELSQNQTETLKHRLIELGFKIIRFENRLVFEHTEAVLEVISSAFAERE